MTKTVATAARENEPAVGKVEVANTNAVTEPAVVVKDLRRTVLVVETGAPPKMLLQKAKLKLLKAHLWSPPKMAKKLLLQILWQKKLTTVLASMLTLVR